MSTRLAHTVDVMQKTYMHLFPTIQEEIVDILNNIKKLDEKLDVKNKKPIK